MQTEESIIGYAGKLEEILVTIGNAKKSINPNSSLNEVLKYLNNISYLLSEAA